MPEKVIRQEGLRPLDLDAVVAEVAAKYGVGEADLWDLMHDFLLHVRRDEGLIHLATNREMACGYASPGSEAEFMVIELVYDLEHGEAEFVRPEQTRWAFEQFRGRRPLLVTVALPPDAAVTGHRGNFTMRGPIPPAWIVDIEPVVDCVCKHTRWTFDPEDPDCRAQCAACGGGKCPAMQADDGAWSA